MGLKHVASIDRVINSEQIRFEILKNKILIKHKLEVKFWEKMFNKV